MRAKENLLDIYNDAVVARDQATARAEGLEDRQIALDELVDAVRNWREADLAHSQGGVEQFFPLVQAEQRLRADWDRYHAAEMMEARQ